MNPFFENAPYKDYLSSFSPEELKKASKDKVIDKRVIALGGINEENIRIIKKYGFGGAAVLGNLWNCYDEHETIDYTEIIKQFRLLKKLAD